MPILPIRGVGDIGVITDIRPYDLPVTAWAKARNVRFRNKKISRSSVFKNLNTSVTFTATPVIAVDASVSGSQGCVVIPQADGVIKQLFNGLVTDVSPTLPVWGTLTSRVTATRLGGVTYLNSEEGGPLYRSKPADLSFSRLPGFGTNYKAKTLRSYRDYVIGLNVTKDSVRYPNMIKWSDVVQAGSPPPNWDVTNLASHAGENVINDARGALVDGLALGNTFILYGSEETYRMYFIGTPLIFAVEKLFDDLGVNGQDCAVEIDGKHYVFGNDQIYMHDGVQKISLSDGKVSEKIFGSINFSKRDDCFVFQNPSQSEIFFCYPSTSDEVKWSSNDVTGCNEAAVYNYTTGVWSFVDLPGITSALMASFPIDTTWNDLGTWATTVGTWRSYEGSEPQLPVVLSSGNPAMAHAAQLYFMDNLKDGFLSNVADSRFLFDGYVETSIKDTDDMGGTLASTKLVSNLFPQALALSPDAYMSISIGSAKTTSSPILWSNPVLFYPETDYKCDFRVTGRYLTMKFIIPALVDVMFSGFDLNISVVAER